MSKNQEIPEVPEWFINLLLEHEYTRSWANDIIDEEEEESEDFHAIQKWDAAWKYLNLLFKCMRAVRYDPQYPISVELTTKAWREFLPLDEDL